MRSDRSLVRRVALAASLAASVAALVAALVTSGLVFGLLRAAEDRRVNEAAVTFATELDATSSDPEDVGEVYLDESAELGHTAMVFAVYEGSRRIVGDPRLDLPAAPGCVSVLEESLRACRVDTAHGLSAVVGAARMEVGPWLAGVAIAAALVAAGVAWSVSFAVSRAALAPLSHLRERIEAVDVQSMSESSFGTEVGVAEIDAVRVTLAQLARRVDLALSQARRFAANAAHELRTPLSSVSAEMELLAEAVSDGDVRADVERAQRRVMELSQLVERLLILTVPPPAPSDRGEDVSMADLLDDAWRALPEADRERLVVEPGDGLVRGDALLLAAMVNNAVTNALKFGRSVVARVSESEGVVVLQVEDDGPGVAGADRERVFEPFVRGDHARRNQLPGHGLGLALIRHVAETHRGRAYFADKSDGGARLVIELRK